VEGDQVIPTPAHLSPLLLAQEFLRDKPWQLLATCILLNQTSGKQVKPMLADFFENWPTPKHFLEASEIEVKKLIKPLGFQNIRYKRLIGMTKDWIDGMRPPGDKLYGVGVYATQSYEIFVLGYLISEPQDKELKHYVKWAQEEAGGSYVRNYGRAGSQEGLSQDQRAT
jgi:methyl-CpG-binding domain protein 4